jgi:hypothetical protein
MNLEQQLKQTLARPAAMPEEAGAYDRFLRHHRRRTHAVAAGAGLTLILLLTVAVTAPRLLAGGDRTAVGAGDQDRPGRLVRVAMEPWQVVRLDGRRLVVRFSGGPPDVPVGRCSPAYEATVSDGVQDVYVTVYVLVPPKTKTLPCPTMNHERTLTVVLPTPLRGRALTDGAGDARMILGAVVREPSYLPVGYERGVIGTSSRRLGHRVAAWQRVQHRADAAQEQLWITQGHPAAVRPRYHPPGAVSHQRARLPSHGVEARPGRRPERPVPVLGRGRNRLPGLQRRQADPAAADRRARAGRQRPSLNQQGNSSRHAT